MRDLASDLVQGIRALPDAQRAIIDRWIDSDPEAVQILISAVPSLRPMFESFINGDGSNVDAAPQVPEQMAQRGAMSGAQILSQIAGR